MIKSELVQQLAAKNPHLFQRDIEKIVNVVLDEIIDAMAQGNRVELRGFGAFTVKHRPPRQGRNPRTGEQVPVDEKFVPFFKTGKELRERLNPGGTKATGSKSAKANGAAKPAAKKLATKKPAKAADKRPAKKAPAKTGAANRRSNGRAADSRV